MSDSGPYEWLTINADGSVTIDIANCSLMEMDRRHDHHAGATGGAPRARLRGGAAMRYPWLYMALLVLDPFLVILACVSPTMRLLRELVVQWRLSLIPRAPGEIPRYDLRAVTLAEQEGY